MKILLLVISLLFAVSSNVSANGNGNDLYDICIGKADFKAGLCSGYLVGVYHSQLMSSVRAKNHLTTMDSAMSPETATTTLDKDGKIYYILSGEAVSSFFSCVPEGLAAQQIVDVVVKWLKENPEQRHHAQYLVVEAAFKQAWPCP